nr:hypothetical protein GCM10025699_34690 [Microbacterium flavescens]
MERRLTNPEIASELFISVRTVESHIASLRRKLGAESRADLVAAAREVRDAAVRVPANPLRGRGRDLSELEAPCARATCSPSSARAESARPASRSSSPRRRPTAPP